MAAESKTTTDHDVIRKWAEDRGGWPATVKGTGDAEEAGILRIGFQDEASLERISWEEVFAKFEDNNLAFLYQEETSSGGESRFFKFVRRDSA